MQLKIFNWARSKTINFLSFWLLTFSRYLHTDYVLDKSLVATALICLVISYDVACQWHKKLGKRMKIFPPDKALSNNIKHVCFLVPKFHLPAHMEACNLGFSFNLMKGIGRTDGEVGLILTWWHRVPRRWGQGWDAIPWTTTSAIGTGRK